MGAPETLEGQPCPMCNKNNLTLMDREDDIPYFGRIHLFSMRCSACKFHKADVECEERKEPVMYSVEVCGKKDGSIRIVKSSEATIKIPHMVTIEPGVGSNGYITNVEGILRRVKQQIEAIRAEDEDTSARKKAKKMLKKISRVLLGSDKLKIVIEDPSGNSAIISRNATVEKLRK